MNLDPALADEPTLFDLDPASASVRGIPAQRDRHAQFAVHVQDILTRLWESPENELDRSAVVTAILLEARANGGLVDPNGVRTRLADKETGKPTVNPRVVGAVYNRLSNAGVLVEHDVIRSTDHVGRNAGKRIPRYRLVVTVDVAGGVL